MIKNFKKIILLVMFSTFLFTFTSCLSDSKKTFNQSNDVHLVLDCKAKNKIPSHFRKSTDKITSTTLNLHGLSELNISGSEQFSLESLNVLLKNLGNSMPIIVIDLRQESHGFINGNAISFEGKKNNANKGLTTPEVLAKEAKQLESIKLNVPITILNTHPISMVPKSVYSELSLTKSKSLSYKRFAVTDGELPVPTVVDNFVAFVNNQPKGTWLHFHCKHGIGRTTTFMIMYDIMNNCNSVSVEDIIKRQILLAKLDIRDSKVFFKPNRVKFFTDFYRYCKENKDKSKTKWSSWNNSSSLFN